MFAYWPNSEVSATQHLEISGNVLSLLPNGGSVTLANLSTSVIPSTMLSLTLQESLNLGEFSVLSSGITTCSEISLFNTSGPNVRLLAGGNTLSLNVGTTTGTIYDTQINPPYSLDHLTVANVMQAATVNAENAQFTNAVVNSLIAHDINTSSIIASSLGVTESVLNIANISSLNVNACSGLIASFSSITANMLGAIANVSSLSASMIKGYYASYSCITTSGVTLQAGTIASAGSNLLWNGSPVALASQVGNVAQWSQYGAATDVTLQGHTLGGVGHMGQTGDATMGFVHTDGFSNTFSMTNVIGDFWVGQKVDYALNRPGFRAYVGHFQVGGAGGTNDVANWPSFAVYPTTVDFGSIVQPCTSFTVQSLGGIQLNSASGLTLNGGGGAAINGGGGVSILGGGGVSVFGGGAVLVDGGDVSITGGLTTLTGGALLVSGGAVTVTSGLLSVQGGGVAISGLLGVTVSAVGGVAITGGNLAITGQNIVVTGGNINMNNGSIHNVANPVNNGDAVNKAYVDAARPVPILQQVNLQQSTILSAVTGITYNFWPQGPQTGYDVQLPDPVTIGSWISIANSSPTYTISVNVYSPFATVQITPNSSKRFVVGLDTDSSPAWFVA